ncbi:quinone-dependent dihydroorotate dehydrogenase [Solirubrobacter deserti]|uniref:Dihydroorotate dehydrogenase (quinone) n=1 Tax=Solirubrobacter deserti TaxID=2282478 RepID=A0ABT4RK53_9ACTN|nr:quinone-dependent dihydroorotate dehydrogenase [Solirubrobacter deserti]MDA0138916.1 quinone-dependent dihydroorotate dehydrogenase [Solirubrobacter deserti]
MYAALYSRVLSRVDAENAHLLGTRALALAARLPRAEADPVLRVRALGLEFDSPLGVAAGLDKHATAFEGLGNLGFGFVEVGTITAHAQPGNPRPRVFRLPADRGLLNAMGFPNPGAQAVVGKLAQRSGRGIVAINIGKSKVTPLEQAAEDYRASAALLAPHADFVVINVSSPNTSGLRDLQTIEHLGELLDAVRGETDKPVLVKLAPDLTDEQLDQLADFAVEAGLDGLIATNTTISREGLDAPADLLARPGGVSGAPLKARSLAVLRRLRARVGDRVLLVSVGGVENAQDVLQRVRAGATLVQGYTGFVYGGPLWARRINRDLGRAVRNAGVGTIQDLVGHEVGIRPGLAHGAPAPDGARD